MSKAQKPYRFAVYGRTASGKTCILAALAMKCVANPSSYTSTWILEPAGLAKPAGEPETWDVGDRASAFHLGKIWLEKAIERLTSGELPPPNPNRAEPLRYLYHLTTPSHRTYPVELIDYSGELLDPSLTDDGMAKRLREHLRTMDGILVLAEVPRPDEDQSLPLSAELHKLEQAFAILKNESKEGPTLDIPLALLINKWDRRSPLRYTSPENEYRELVHFLETKPEPPHRALVDALRNSVTRDNFQVFPVSAFGEHELTRAADNAVIERPKSVSPLQSFGLEDGFIWAAQRRDTIDISRFKEQVSEKSAWCLMKNASIVFSLPLILQGRALAQRFPAKSPERMRITRALRRYYLTITANVCCLLLLLFSVFTTVEGIHDKFHYRSILATKSDPQATLQKLREDEAWLAAYYRSPFYRHTLSRFVVMDSAEAIATLRSFRERREEMQWRPVVEAKDELVRADLARKYLKQYGENGVHADRAKAIVTAAEQTRKYRTNRNYIEKIATAYEAALLKGTPSEEELNDLYRQLLTLPDGAAVNEETQARQKEILDRITTTKIKIVKEQRHETWLITRDRYLEAMREGDIVRSADLLDRMRTQTAYREKTRKLVADYKKRAVPLLIGRIDEKSQRKLWGQARNLLQEALDNQQLVELLGAAQLKKLQKQQGGLDVAEDRDLYAQVVKYKDQERISQYLKYAPLKKMARSVNRYQQHLNQVANPLDLKLVLDNFSWEGSCNPKDLFVTLNGKTFIEKTDITAPRNGVYSQVGSVHFRRKLSDLTKIHAKVSCTSWWSENTGEANWEGAVATLGGLRLQLAGKDGPVGTITFTLAGQPEEPDLPPWGS